MREIFFEGFAPTPNFLFIFFWGGGRNPPKLQNATLIPKESILNCTDRTLIIISYLDSKPGKAYNYGWGRGVAGQGVGADLSLRARQNVSPTI